MPRSVLAAVALLAVLAAPTAAQAQAGKLKDKARDIAGQNSDDSPGKPTRPATYALLKVVGLDGTTRFELIEDRQYNDFKKKLKDEYTKASKEYKEQKRSAASRKIEKPSRPKVTKLKGRIKTREDAEALLKKEQEDFQKEEEKRKRRAEAARAAKQRAREEAERRRRSGGWG